MPVAFNLLVIRVFDLERARQFYEALGLTFTREQHGSGPEHLASTCDGTVFELYPSGENPPTSGIRLGFRVSSIRAVLLTLAEIDAEVVSPPTDSPWGLRAVICDPDGNRVELTQ
jgi:lactoylglutathione lyase